MSLEDKEVTTRIMESDRDALNLISQKMGMKASLILGHLIDLAQRHGLLESGWEDRLAEARFHEMLLEADIEYKKGFERDKHRAILQAKQIAFKEYLKVMTASEKKTFLEQVLGETGGDLLDSFQSYQMFVIDGEKKFLAPNPDGSPNIPGVSRDALIECERGWHMTGGFCRCNLWRDCPMRSEEYIDYLAKHGTESQRRRYLDRSARRA